MYMNNTLNSNVSGGAKALLLEGLDRLRRSANSAINCCALCCIVRYLSVAQARCTTHS